MNAPQTPDDGGRIPQQAETTSTAHPLADRIVDQVEALVEEAETAGQPIEVDPFRKQLFELFVTAEGAGYVVDGGDPDLTSDGLCQTLAGRWGLKDAAQESFTSQTRMHEQHVQKMRSLWSVMRMWMEWSYAWERWPEFHSKDAE
ncbi:hypothetical protein Mal4_58800 [Maioricimonas rarisocia]|uniref:Uncharacterized protein n=1 Tax=Maioricimonas rarisocia TaxID=2528026 RepID=A0A517ZGE6_9PLAN|nr:hypothetical protein [Maioricimonas rarisocia]QDU41512.1 hypothetical protein Mal4_58800 [Maioricimonas rarisocia]